MSLAGGKSASRTKQTRLALENLRTVRNTYSKIRNKDVDATRRVFLVKFGAVNSYCPSKKINKWYGHQNCGVKGHREMKAEYGKIFLRKRDHAVAEGYWRVDETVYKGKEC
ncbi:unnamed protein product [Symbiodinium natans]|uniref:Uncharacterized protein n=1 Tax=Symbiodinium natans TaxID=878477 RepID=A0A812NZ98_9DINO|nr:unnamed protein product [Symbiodinium natans]